MSLTAAFGAVLVLAGPSIGAPQESKTDDRVSEARSREIARVREAYHLTDRFGEAIWPGFNLREIPILVNVDDREELLFGHPQPPEGFQVLEGHEIEGEPIHVRAPVTFSFVGTAMDIGGVQTSLVTPFRMREPGTEHYLATLVHESFHAYQQGFRGYWAAGNSNEPYDPAYCASTGIESRILDAALRTDSAEERDGLLRQFVAVRRARLAGLEEIDVTREFENEFLEGTATYAQTRLLKLLADAKGVHPVGTTPDPEYSGFSDAEVMYAKLRNEISKPRSGRFDNHHAIYFNGLGICLLLDEVLPGWKTKVRKGDSDATPPHPWGLLEEKYSSENDERERLVDEARTRIGYDQLFAEQKALLDARIATMKDVLLAPGRRYRIHYGGLYGHATPIATPEGPVHVVPAFLADEVEELLAQRGFDSAAIRSYADMLVCEGGVTSLTAPGVVYEGVAEPTVWGGAEIEWIDRDPAPDGSDLVVSFDRVGDGVHHGLRVNTDGFTLTAAHASIEVGDDLVTIRLEAAERASGARDRPVTRSVRFLAAEDGEPVANRSIQATSIVRQSGNRAIAVGGRVTTDETGHAEVSLPPGRGMFRGAWEGAPDSCAELEWNEDLPEAVEIRIFTEEPPDD